MKKVAIIDLGSSSARLVIYEIGKENTYCLIDDIKSSIRMSENMENGEYLNKESIIKAIRVVRLFNEICAEHNINNNDIIAVTTEAVRKAKNGKHFIKLVKKIIGIKFKILSDTEEAFYSYKSVIHTVNINNGIVIDIGGASTEIIKFENNTITNLASLPIGAVLATENFLEKDIVTDQSLSSLEEHLHKTISSISWLLKEQSQLIIGVGGTIKAIAKIHREYNNYPLKLIHNYAISKSDFMEIYEDLCKTNLNTRKTLPGLSPDRADIIIGGFTIFKVLISKLHADSLIISNYGIREGILFQHLSKVTPEINFINALDFSLNNHLKLLGMDTQHNYRVCSLALLMFDQLKSLHTLECEERKILRIASLLHNISLGESDSTRSINIFQNIIDLKLNGVTHRELILIAAIAASYTPDALNLNWKEKYEQLLQPCDIEIFNKLSLFVQIAEALDKDKRGNVLFLKCNIDKNVVTFETIAKNQNGIKHIDVTLYSQKFKELYNKILKII